MAEQAKKVYFGVQARKRLELEDGQWIEVKKLSEAQKNEYLNSLGSLAERVEADGKFQINPTKVGDLNKITLDLCISDFHVNLERADGTIEMVGSGQISWDELYQQMDADTGIVEKILALAEEVNPWLAAKPSSEKKTTA